MCYRIFCDEFYRRNHIFHPMNIRYLLYYKNYHFAVFFFCFVSDIIPFNNELLLFDIAFLHSHQLTCIPLCGTSSTHLQSGCLYYLIFFFIFCCSMYARETFKNTACDMVPIVEF